MSSFGGLIKAASCFNRIQQKKDWALLKNKFNCSEAEPDWTLSVKKIDKYMISVCQKHGIDYLSVFGHG